MNQSIVNVPYSSIALDALIKHNYLDDKFLQQKVFYVADTRTNFFFFTAFLVCKWIIKNEQLFVYMLRFFAVLEVFHSFDQYSGSEINHFESGSSN